MKTTINPKSAVAAKPEYPKLMQYCGSDPYVILMYGAGEGTVVYSKLDSLVGLYIKNLDMKTFVPFTGNVILTGEG